VKLSNTEYGTLSNVTIKASLTSGDMTASATNTANETTTTSGHVNVSLPSTGSLSYISGSTEVYNVDGQFVKNLADGIATTGTNAGALAGSTREFVQFKAKVNCQTVKQINVCDLKTNKVVTINEDQFDASKHSKDLTLCQTTTPPTTLVNTGAGSVAAVAAAVAAVSAVAYNAVVRRRAARQ
jgi:hypothetical protein